MDLCSSQLLPAVFIAKISIRVHVGIIYINTPWDHQRSQVLPHEHIVLATAHLGADKRTPVFDLRIHTGQVNEGGSAVYCDSIVMSTASLPPTIREISRVPNGLIDPARAVPLLLSLLVSVAFPSGTHAVSARSKRGLGTNQRYNVFDTAVLRPPGKLQHTLIYRL